MAQLEDLVESLPFGLSTKMLEFGRNLSGGQKQRIGIARALITRPKFLLLDEATSALDHITQENISKVITSLHGNCTVLMIAHRFESLQFCDRVLEILSPSEFVFWNASDFIKQGIFKSQVSQYFTPREGD